MRKKTSMPKRAGQPGGAGDVLGAVHRMGVGSQGSQLRCGVMHTRAEYIERQFVTPQYAVVYLPGQEGGRGRPRSRNV